MNRVLVKNQHAQTIVNDECDLLLSEIIKRWNKLKSSEKLKVATYLRLIK